VSLRNASFSFTQPILLASVALFTLLPAAAQYPGQITKVSQDAPTLRSVAVFEWTGDQAHPKASRLIPVSVFDGQDLQDGGIYLARPQPLALSAEVEYELKENGKTVGLFDISGAGQEQGSWVGLGAWKPLPAARPAAQKASRNSLIDDEESGRPVLHRKHHPGDALASGSSSNSGSAAPAPASDPDRPKLHKKDSSNSSDTGTASSPAPDPDRPTLHKQADNSASDSAASDDPDRPKLKKAKKKKQEDVGHVESLPGVTDPDRPQLKRGKSSGNNLTVAPTLMGLPPDMHQAVAVSDAKNRPEHLWNFTWANPDDEDKMKLALEDIARSALGLNPPPPPAAPAPKRAASRKKATPTPPPPPPAPLADEQFRVFELAYGSGATLVLSARTDDQSAPQKFVTLVAQPDLYGNVLVLLKSVTDTAHLDVTPRMRLVDAVDAMADNRGELLFELRGSTERQFALYRVLRGQADKLFASAPGDIAPQGAK
jgi:hypothetical protein